MLSCNVVVGVCLRAAIPFPRLACNVDANFKAWLQTSVLVLMYSLSSSCRRPWLTWPYCGPPHLADTSSALPRLCTGYCCSSFTSSLIRTSVAASTLARTHHRCATSSHHCINIYCDARAVYGIGLLVYACHKCACVRKRDADAGFLLMAHCGFNLLGGQWLRHAASYTARIAERSPCEHWPRPHST